MPTLADPPYFSYNGEYRPRIELVGTGAFYTTKTVTWDGSNDPNNVKELLQRILGIGAAILLLLRLGLWLRRIFLADEPAKRGDSPTNYMLHEIFGDIDFRGSGDDEAWTGAFELSSGASMGVAIFAPPSGPTDAHISYFKQNYASEEQIYNDFRRHLKSVDLENVDAPKFKLDDVHIAAVTVPRGGDPENPAYYCFIDKAAGTSCYYVLLVSPDGNAILGPYRRKISLFDRIFVTLGLREAYR